MSYDEQPDGDPHGECAHEIRRLERDLAAAQAERDAAIKAAVQQERDACASLALLYETGPTIQKMTARDIAQAICSRGEA